VFLLVSRVPASLSTISLQRFNHWDRTDPLPIERRPFSFFSVFRPTAPSCFLGPHLFRPKMMSAAPPELGLSRKPAPGLSFSWPSFNNHFSLMCMTRVFQDHLLLSSFFVFSRPAFLFSPFPASNNFLCFCPPEMLSGCPPKVTCGIGSFCPTVSAVFSLFRRNVPGFPHSSAVFPCESLYMTLSADILSC